MLPVQGNTFNEHFPHRGAWVKHTQSVLGDLHRGAWMKHLGGAWVKHTQSVLSDPHRGAWICTYILMDTASV